MNDGHDELFRRIRVVRVHLLDKHDLSLDVEPDARVTLGCGLVLPTLVLCIPSPDDLQLTAQRVVRRRLIEGVLVRKSHVSVIGLRIVATRSRQPF